MKAAGSNVWSSNCSFVLKKNKNLCNKRAETVRDQNEAALFSSAHIDCPSPGFSTICNQATSLPAFLIHYLFVYQPQSVLAFHVIWTLFANSLSSLSFYFYPLDSLFCGEMTLPLSVLFLYRVYITFYISLSMCFIMWTCQKKKKKRKPKVKLKSVAKPSDSSWSLTLCPLLTSHFGASQVNESAP